MKHFFLLVLSFLGVVQAYAQEPKTPAAGAVHNYVFFNRDRGRISEATFLDTKAIEGAQLKYTWRELERGEGGYEFDDIRRDLSFLDSKGKKLWIQIQDVSFDPAIVSIPQYLIKKPQYHGGADQQFEIVGDDDTHAKPAGWVARRWDPAVRDRFAMLLLALGTEFDGKIEGVNLPETAVDFGQTGALWPRHFSPEKYRDAIIDNMAALKRAFPKSVAMQYVNFMPEEQGEKLPWGNLRKVYLNASRLGMAVGGPDLLPYKPYQMNASYPLLRAHSGRVPKGIAVQDGNYEHVNPKTAKRVSIEELYAFASEYLEVRYIFWGAQEPYYSQQVIPFLKARQ